MRILLSNDDGVHALGIATLAEVLGEIANIDVICPDRNRSGASNSLTLDHPLKPKKLSNGFYHIDGTPTDCVHLALSGFFENKPDLVVSGINEGANLGEDVLYSGTVAAAIAARNEYFPSIAVSLVGTHHYETAAIVAKLIVKQLKSDPLPANTILNVNIPDVPFQDLKGFEITRLGKRHITKPMVTGTDGQGESIFWIAPLQSVDKTEPGTDFHAIKGNYVSITPLHTDWTNYPAFEQLSSWIINLSLSK